MRRAIVGMLAAAAAVGCEPGVSFSTSDGTLKMLNGPTQGVPMLWAARRAEGDGGYALSPARMTMTVTGIAFIPEGQTETEVYIVSVDGCSATYDRALGSLVELANCGITAPVGTFMGVTIGYGTTYEVVVDDAAAGVFSDPDAPGGLATTRPAGGARPITIRDQNSSNDWDLATTWFTSPLEISEESPLQIYVVFDPTHWIKAERFGGVFSAPLMAGNPPIIPAVSGFGKAAFYSNLASPMSFNQSACQDHSCTGFLFLYADADHPISVTWQAHDVCGSMGGVVSFNGDGTRWGTYGRLGLDADRVLAWAAAAPGDGDEIGGYRGVFKMPERAAVGDNTTLDYRCAADVPPPSSGPNYSSGAPGFLPDGSLTLTLLAQ